MKRIIRLTESDLARIVRRVINEETQHSGTAMMDVYGAIGVQGFFAPNDKINLEGKMRNFDPSKDAKIFNGTVTITPEGTNIGLKSTNFTLPSFPILQPMKPGNDRGVQKFRGRDGREYYGVEKIFNVGFTAPAKAFKNNTGKPIHLATLELTTNSYFGADQPVKIMMANGAQFGVSGAESKS